MEKIFFLAIWLASTAQAQENLPLKVYYDELLARSEQAMPVVDLPFEKVAAQPGWEERGSEFRKWLSPSVRFRNGSGTMCCYDGEWMYVITAGHLFGRGYRSAKSLRERPREVTIEVFYHNNKVLDAPKKYKGWLLCSVWGNSQVSSIYDVALVKFKPDWKDPFFMPIAPKDYKYKTNGWYHSTGCDGLTPPAHYLVQFKAEQKRGN